MNAHKHPSCYGNLFPDKLDASTKGKAFSLHYVTPTGMFPRRSRPVVDIDAWDECAKCPEFENCYKLSMARLLLAQASGAL